MPQILSRYVGRTVGLVVASALLAIAVPASDGFAAKRKNASENWSQKVVTPNGEIVVPDVACQAYEKRMSKHIERMRQLRGRISSGASAPPGTVVAILKSLSGQKEESAAVTSAKKSLVKERKAADQLNHLLADTNCRTVDIDKALEGGAKGGGPEKKPELPKKPDEIMQTPQ